MTTIHNSKIQERILREAKIQLSVDSVPTQLAEKVVPVLISNPVQEVFVKRGTASDSTSATIYTASTTKRTYLTGMLITLTKDDSNTGKLSNIGVTLKTGLFSFIGYIRYRPSNAAEYQQSVFFSEPLEIEPGSGVILNNQSATASIDTTGVIFGYETD